MWLQMKGGIASLEAAIEFSMAKWFFQTCSFSSISQKKTKLAPLQERKMIDRFKLFAKGGDGGNGCASFRRSRHERRGRPDGGNGGKGGDVVLECSTTVWDFSGLQHHINAKRGGNGTPKNMIGSRGADKIVQVPIGTVIHLLQGEVPTFVEKKPSGSVDPWEIPDKLDSGFSEFREPPSLTKETRKLDMKKAGEPEKFRSSAQKLSQHDTAFSVEDEVQNQPQAHSLTAGNRQYSALGNETSMFEPEFEEDLLDIKEVIELTEPGEQVIVARGGNGGFGNLHTARGFNISNHDNENANDEPSLDNLGQPGSETLVMLELKTIADVGLVGMPNAGKSTLLGALSRAKPRVGHYAFTTLRPNLGKLNYDDISITVADVPGLIRAHENRGLGHAFLRHIERTKVLAYVVDLGRKDTPPWEQLRDLILELEMYNSSLSDRPSLIVANKIDEEGAEDALEQLKRRVAHVPIFPVCAVLEEGMHELKPGLKELVRPVEVEQDSLKLKIEHILLD